ncbi:tripartite tricarboxylate transporter permease [Geoglobus acetivorans]|uniref:Tripartite tricarboxylate transporter permease n=1 Tax=Geoglobus acetivorans TaxID=565033 RepID=A0ABZ3H0P6_GEOAI|nr:tripartite tricarboxylate transporter permease [Geoglobus acetivorans]
MAPELLGFILGVIAGLVPGIHPNTFSALILGASFLFSAHFTGSEIAIMIFVSSAVYSVVNIIPAVFVGVPDEDTSLAVFPAHRMVLDGEGFAAISISAVSSFLSSLLCVPVYYLILLAGKSADLSPLTTPVLIAVATYLILIEDDRFGGSFAKWKKRLLAAVVFLLSGAIGVISLRHFYSDGISMLFPLLTGLFAFPTLVAGINSESIPDQRIEFVFPEFKNVLKGVVSGLFVSLFPGISSGVATAISVGRGDDEKKYISSISSANTANTILNFAVLQSAGRARSGTADAFLYFTSPENYGYLPILALSASFVAMAFSLLISVPAMGFFSRISPSKLSRSVIAFLIFAVLYFTGFDGIAVFSVASAIGMLTLLFRVRRIHCMGAIILPAILY